MSDTPQQSDTRDEGLLEKKKKEEKEKKKRKKKKERKVNCGT